MTAGAVHAILRSTTRLQENPVIRCVETQDGIRVHLGKGRAAVACLGVAGLFAVMMLGAWFGPGAPDHRKDAATFLAGLAAIYAWCGAEHW